MLWETILWKKRLHKVSFKGWVTYEVKTRNTNKKTDANGNRLSQSCQRSLRNKVIKEYMDNAANRGCTIKVIYMGGL